MKFTDAGARRDIHSQKGQPIKMMAKHWEKEVGARPDWGFIHGQSGAFREELARTGERFIVEKNVHARLSDDGTVWSGPNLMGRLLMELRDNGGLEYSLPDGISEFRDLR